MNIFADVFNTIILTAVNVNIDQYVYFFIGSFFFIFLLSRFTPLHLKIYTAFESKIMRFLHNRDLFYVTDAHREEIWLNFLRILFGYTLFVRSFWIFYYELVIGGSTTRACISFIDLSSSFFVMIGFITPFFTGVLFLFHTYIHDMLLQTYTLGSCLAQILLMIFFFLPAGRKLSIDALILATSSLPGRLLNRFYQFIGFPSMGRIGIVKLCGFLSYGLLCMYSVYKHFLDPYWSTGIANVMLLSSNWLVAPYESFRYLFSTYGKPAIIISEISLYIMMAWEFVIIPFTLIKGITRAFVIWWGLAFFVVSLFILQLSWLPHYQFILYAILFWPGFFLNREGKSTLELYYDDKCNLCDRTIRFITAIDWFSVIKLRPLSQNHDLIQSRNLTADQVFQDLYGYEIASGRVYKGYDLYLHLASKLFLVLPLYPLLWLGRLLYIGPPIYAMIAKHRRQWFGVCQIPSINLAALRGKEDAGTLTINPPANTFFSTYLLTYLIFLAVYLINYFPYFDYIPGWNYLRKPIQFISFTPPALNGQIKLEVFTPDVIWMGSHYFTVTGVFSNGAERLLPYVGKDGERLSLVRRSDRLYFGHSLGWRRKMYGKFSERVCYDSKRDDEFLFSLFKVAEFVWKDKPTYYRIDYYNQSLPDPKAVAHYEYKLLNREHVCTVIATAHNEWSIEPQKA